ncbi:hypothetical protein ACPX19_06905 [Winogradskyella sp. HB-48]|uniref:hypothetical protein n=1 Tax=Winogradskyella sp. HB-48 TaxID=3416808 RepID=UPI003CE71137
MSCSSNDNEEGYLSTENSFKVLIDGETYIFNTFMAIKNHDNFEVRGSINNQESIYIRFNSNGILDYANFYINGTSTDYKSSYYFPKHTFSISGIAIDNVNKVVSADFEGSIFDNNYDVSSNVITLAQGSFNLVFVDSPGFIDKFIDAKINGQNFESVKHFTSSDDLGIFKIGGVSDNEFTFTINFDAETFLTDTFQGGTYQFFSSDEINSVGLIFYNPYNNIYEEYDFSGTLVIDEPNSESQTFVSGSFSGTALNDNGESFNISDGEFNLIFI